MTGSKDTTGKAPLNPYAVLALAVILPGMGHVAVGQPQRGFGFAFFTLLLALITYAMTPPDRSFIGRAAFGLFVWALSIPDAYRIARTQWEIWQRSQSTTHPVIPDARTRGPGPSAKRAKH